VKICKRAGLEVCPAQNKKLAVEFRMHLFGGGWVVISDMNARQARQFAEAILAMLDEREAK
jgi:hypothetical protein